VGGVDEGCLRAQCVLLGGETAEHPGHFKADDDFDMAGFAVGLAERDELWGPGNVVAGDVLIGIDSHGLHSNGFSLVRHLIARYGIDLGARFLDPGLAHGDTTPPDTLASLPCFDPAATVGDVLLTPTAIYSPVLHDLGHAGGVHAAAHVTGGGFPDNVGRAVPDDLAAEIDLAAWTPGPVFSWLHRLGVSRDELLRTFNCGLGMVLVVAADAAERLLDVTARGGHGARVVGAVVARGDGEAVRYRGELSL
jgi:phosphoribosylformylglycinamidine cyclo-ligase